MKLAYSLGIGVVLLALILASAGLIPAQQHASISLTISVTHLVTLGWTASTTTNVVGYRVYRGTSSSGPWQALSTGNFLSYQDAGVTKGATYFYYVTAIDVNNLESDPSNQVTAVIPTT